MITDNYIAEIYHTAEKYNLIEIDERWFVESVMVADDESNCVFWHDVLRCKFFQLLTQGSES